ncbi:MAG TPA: FkbM family methyltransferase [Acidobacteriaceae bacterium]|nr:FkbM family methyltransferase [Acidobacteriaceae bacterium]
MDIGANEGQYADELRTAGFAGEIVSMEPNAAAYHRLAKRAQGVAHWRVLRMALGATEGTADLRVTSSDDLSSFLTPTLLMRHVLGENATAVVRTESVPVTTLASLMHREQWNVTTRTLLKLDTQGYEREILEGAGPLLEHFAGLQLELSLRPLYDGQPPIEEVIRLLRQRGFVPYDLWPVVRDHTWAALEVDCLFYRPA